MSAREFIERVDLGDELRAHAAISSRPGQLDELEALADRADRYAAALRAVLDEIERAEDLVRQSTPPKTAEALIRNGDAPKVTTGTLRRAITDALGGEQA